MCFWCSFQQHCTLYDTPPWLQLGHLWVLWNTTCLTLIYYFDFLVDVIFKFSWLVTKKKFQQIAMRNTYKSNLNTPGGNQSITNTELNYNCRVFNYEWYKNKLNTILLILTSSPLLPMAPAITTSFPSPTPLHVALYELKLLSNKILAKSNEQVSLR